jgi:hypothetical protein
LLFEGCSRGESLLKAQVILSGNLRRTEKNGEELGASPKERSSGAKTPFKVQGSTMYGLKPVPFKAGPPFEFFTKL